jgi:hypothetical protein
MHQKKTLLASGQLKAIALTSSKSNHYWTPLILTGFLREGLLQLRKGDADFTWVFSASLRHLRLSATAAATDSRKILN